MTVEPPRGREVAPSPKLNWRNIAFLAVSPIAAFVGIAFYMREYGFHPADLLCFCIMMVLTGLAITAGYHRYYSHRSYECHPLIQAYYLLFGAAALQAPLLKWVADHRDHHRYVDDRDCDPYSISRGFFWAHVGWTFYADDGYRKDAQIEDLARKKSLILQERYHELLGLTVGLGVPFLIGLAFGRPLAGVLWGGLLRVVVAHHGTFLINSAGHYFGRQPYSERNSARDCAWLAMLTLGEGYHNFHHAFPRDFRNGVRWYQWDPTKWWILGLRRVGLAWRLRSTPWDRLEKMQLQRTAAAA